MTRGLPLGLLQRTRALQARRRLASTTLTATFCPDCNSYSSFTASIDPSLISTSSSNKSSSNPARSTPSTAVPSSSSRTSSRTTTPQNLRPTPRIDPNASIIYEALLTELSYPSQPRDTSKLLQLFQQLDSLSHLHLLSPTEFNLLFKFLLALPPSDLSLSESTATGDRLSGLCNMLLDRMARLGYEVTIEDFKHVLECWSRLGYAKGSIEMWERMKRARGVRIDEDCYGLILFSFMRWLRKAGKETHESESLPSKKKGTKAKFLLRRKNPLVVFGTKLSTNHEQTRNRIISLTSQIITEIRSLNLRRTPFVSSLIIRILRLTSDYESVKSALKLDYSFDVDYPDSIPFRLDYHTEDVGGEGGTGKEVIPLRLPEVNTIMSILSDRKDLSKMISVFESVVNPLPRERFATRRASKTASSFFTPTKPSTPPPSQEPETKPVSDLPTAPTPTPSIPPSVKDVDPHLELPSSAPSTSETPPPPSPAPATSASPLAPSRHAPVNATTYKYLIRTSLQSGNVAVAKHYLDLSIEGFRRELFCFSRAFREDTARSFGQEGEASEVNGKDQVESVALAIYRSTSLPPLPPIPAFSSLTPLQQLHLRHNLRASKSFSYSLLPLVFNRASENESPNILRFVVQRGEMVREWVRREMEVLMGLFADEFLGRQMRPEGEGVGDWWIRDLFAHVTLLDAVGRDLEANLPIMKRRVTYVNFRKVKRKLSKRKEGLERSLIPAETEGEGREETVKLVGEGGNVARDRHELRKVTARLKKVDEIIESHRNLSHLQRAGPSTAPATELGQGQGMGLVAGWHALVGKIVGTTPEKKERKIWNERRQVKWEDEDDFLEKGGGAGSTSTPEMSHSTKSGRRTGKEAI